MASARYPLAARARYMPYCHQKSACRKAQNPPAFAMLRKRLVDKYSHFLLVESPPTTFHSRTIPDRGAGMRLTPLIIALTCIVNVGCAKNSLECMTGTGQIGCAPGTAGYEQAAQQQEDTKTMSTLDDARCRSYGDQPGSAAYAECRRKTMAARNMFGTPDFSKTGSIPKSN